MGTRAVCARKGRSGLDGWGALAPYFCFGKKVQPRELRGWQSASSIFLAQGIEADWPKPRSFAGSVHESPTRRGVSLLNAWLRSCTAIDALPLHQQPTVTTLAIPHDLNLWKQNAITDQN